MNIPILHKNQNTASAHCSTPKGFTSPKNHQPPAPPPLQQALESTEGGLHRGLGQKLDIVHILPMCSVLALQKMGLVWYLS